MSMNDVFTFTWVIENFNMCPHISGQCICSPEFTIENFQNTSWILVLYPRGTNLIFSEYLGIYLCRMDDISIRNFKIDFTVSIQEITKQAKYSFKKISYSGWYKFIKLKSVEHLNDCIVKCHMRLSTTTVSAPNYGLSSRFLSLKLNFYELKKEKWRTTKQIRTVLKPQQLYANQCVVRTRFFVVRRIFTCVVNDYIYPGSKRRQNIPVNFSSESLVIVLFMRKRKYRDVLEMEIHLESDQKLSYFLICKVELFNFERQIYDSAEKQYLFGKYTNDKSWNFRHSFKWGDIKGKGTNLQFTLTFSNGKHFSDLDCIPDENNWVSSPIFQSNVAANMYRLFTQKKFCDVKLRMKDEKSIDVHKVVLCSRSPVFAAMFESGMKESKTHAIEIEDLNYDTMNQMLSFMYTDFVEGLNEESAKSLFVAADKYEIKSLKDSCRFVLKSKLNLENICSILLLADTHQDKDLMHFAVTFFAENKNDILISVQWKELEENNIRLALDTLKKACLKLFSL